ncbi:hypothetical protein FOCC_FOCC001955, partial [Frankliniella occidentalis]
MPCPYTDYYVHQAQTGRGINHYYSGAAYQKGHGIGSFLTGLFRFAAPLVRKAATAVGKQALIAGSNVVTDTLVNNHSFKDSVNEQWNQSKGVLANSAKETVQKMVGSGRIRKRKRSSKRQSTRNAKRRRTASKTGSKRRTTKRKPQRRRKAPKRKAPRRKKATKKPMAHECVLSQLDLFSSPLHNGSVKNGYDVVYDSSESTTENKGVIRINVPPAIGDDYTDLKSTRLYIQAQIPQDPTPAGANAPPTPEVGPINNWAHSLFSQIDLILNGKRVTSPDYMYPWRAYMETLLNYGAEAKNSHLTKRLFYKDTARCFNKRTAANAGYLKRATAVAEGKVVDLVTNLHLDMFSQERYLLNGVEMGLRLHRAKDEFHLMGPENSKAECKILRAALIVRKVKINPSILIAHSKVLATTPAKYPLKRVEMKSFTINAGLKSKIIDSAIQGTMAKRVVLGVVSNSAFNGSFPENPLEFIH